MACVHLAFYCAITFAQKRDFFSAPPKRYSVMSCSGVWQRPAVSLSLQSDASPRRSGRRARVYISTQFDSFPGPFGGRLSR